MQVLEILDVRNEKGVRNGHVGEWVLKGRFLVRTKETQVRSVTGTRCGNFSIDGLVDVIFIGISINCQAGWAWQWYVGCVLLGFMVLLWWGWGWGGVSSFIFYFTLAIS